jgi:hypothetical protein
VLKMYQQILASLGDELQLAAIGVRVDDAGTVRLTTRVRLTPNGDWAKAAGEVKEAPKNAFGGLPSGPFVMEAAMQYGKSMQYLVRYFIDGDGAKLNPALAKLSPEQLAKWGELTGRLMSEQDSSKFWIGTTKPDEPLLANAMMVTKVADAKKYFADLEELSKVRLKFGDNLPETPAFGDIRHFKLEDREALEVTSSLDQLDQLGDSPAAKPMKAVFGKILGSGEKILTYMAAVDDQTIVSAYVTEDNLRRAIAAVKAKADAKAGGTSGGTTNPQALDVAALLPSGSQWVALVQPSGVAQWILEGLSVAKDVDPPSIDFPDSPPIGLALKISASGVHGEVVIPGPSLEAVGKIVPMMRAAK